MVITTTMVTEVIMAMEVTMGMVMTITLPTIQMDTIIIQVITETITTTIIPVLILTLDSIYAFKCCFEIRGMALQN